VSAIPLAAQFVERAGASAGPATSELEARLNGLVALARAAWPAFDLDAARFVDHLAARLPEGGTVALEQLHLADLYLACACLNGVPGAVDAFERSILAEVPLFVSRLHLSPPQLDELRQQLRYELLVSGSAGMPKLRSYSGTGALGGWVRIVSVRAAIQLQRGQSAIRDDAVQQHPAATGRDPERDLLFNRYRPQFEAALRVALDQLSERDQTLLRQHLVEEMTIDDLGARYRVHRATAARWLQSAREGLLDSVRQQLSTSLGLSGSEFTSLAGALWSQLDVSLSGLFLGSPRRR
jgi:RNA polymerase sigma-70 factor (ECF subfamily)